MSSQPWGGSAWLGAAARESGHFMVIWVSVLKPSTKSRDWVPPILRQLPELPKLGKLRKWTRPPATEGAAVHGRADAPLRLIEHHGICWGGSLSAQEWPPAVVEAGKERRNVNCGHLDPMESGAFEHGSKRLWVADGKAHSFVHPGNIEKPTVRSQSYPPTVLIQKHAAENSLSPGRFPAFCMQGRSF